MMPIFRYSLCWILFFGLYGMVFAQTTLPNDMTVTLRKADAAYKVRDYATAKVLYQQVLAGDSTQYHSCVQLANINKEQREYAEAIRLYERATRLNSEGNDQLFWELGLLNKYIGEYAKAKYSFLMFQSKHANKQSDQYNRSEKELEGCSLQKELKKPQFYVKNLSEANSVETDAFPVLFNGTKYLLFSSNRYGALNKVPYSLLVLDRKDDSTFNPVTNEIALPATKKKAGGFAASATSDGLTMYFTNNLKKKKHRFITGIYSSTFDLKSRKWSKPILLTKLNGIKQTEIKGKVKLFPANNLHPAISGDGNTLVFCSDRDGGKGGLDLWISQKTPEGWISPMHLGELLNTPFDEVSPSLNRDGTKLYFSSEALVGYGGQDIYLSEKQGGSFGVPQHLRFPLNSTYDDFAAFSYGNDSMFYFTSNRAGGTGREDIYWGKIMNYPDEPIKIALTATLTDAQTQLPIPYGEIEVVEMGITPAQNKTSTLKADARGNLKLAIESDKNYQLTGLVDGYIPKEEKVFYKGEDLPFPKGKDKELRLNRPLLISPDTAGVTAAKDITGKYKINNIYYDYDKYFIRTDAALELNKLADLLVTHPNLVIEIASHTDTHASDSYNQHLSELRAMAAVKYLADKGIDPFRMTFKGMGESRPIYSPEKTDLEAQMNRRTEFRITSSEYVPKPPAPKSPLTDKKGK